MLECQLYLFKFIAFPLTTRLYLPEQIPIEYRTSFNHTQSTNAASQPSGPSRNAASQPWSQEMMQYNNPLNQATLLPFNVTEAPGPHLSITDPTRKIVYCPYDTPWKEIRDLEALITQCRMRSLSDDGDMSTLQQRLQEYQKTHKHENKARAGL